MIRNNLSYKLLALLIALIISAYVNQSQSPGDDRDSKNLFTAQEFTISLDARSPEPGCVVTSMPGNIRVRVEGRQEDVFAVTAQQSEIAAYVNLSDKGPGRHRLPVVVKLPDEFTGVVKKLPRPLAVTVLLEEKIQREMSIELRTRGSLPEGYRFEEPELMPSKAVVYGVSRRVDQVSSLVVTIDLAKLTETGIVGDFPVVLLDGQGQRVGGVELIPRTTHVRMVLAETPIKRTALVSLNTLGQPTFPYRVAAIEVEPDSLTVMGRRDRISALTMLQTEPLVLTNRRQSFTQRLRVIAPAGVELPDGNHVTITIKIASPPITPVDPPETEDPDGRAEAGR